MNKLKMIKIFSKRKEKVMKKLSCIVLTLMLVCTMIVPSFAATNNHTITLTGAEAGHTYEAYQVFAGNYSASKDNFSNVSWGKGVNGTELLADLSKTDAFKECMNAEDVAAVLSKMEDNSAALDAFAKVVSKHLTSTKSTANVQDANKNYVITVDADGYYFVKDVTDLTDKNDAATKYVLEVIGDATVAVKSDKPDVDKVIVNADSANGNDGKGTAVNVGDTVTFKVTSKVPKMDGYDKYDYIVKDTMSAGLTLNSDVKVTIGGQDYTGFTKEINGQNITITFNSFINQKDNAGKEIVITYSAVLNKNALTTDVENNSVYLEYSNKPENSEDHGKTPEKKVYVYDFDLQLDKYDGANEATKLAGAKFVLMNDEGKYYAVDSETKAVSWVADQKDAEEVMTDEKGYAEFTGLDAGKYQLKETVAPDGYNLLKNSVEVEITAKYDNDGKLIESSAKSVNAAQYEQTEEIANNTGMVLPSTGGIGTKIFYALGALLVIGSGIVLVVRRRLENEA